MLMHSNLSAKPSPPFSRYYEVWKASDEEAAKSPAKIQPEADRAASPAVHPPEANEVAFPAKLQSEAEGLPSPAHT